MASEVYFYAGVRRDVSVGKKKSHEFVPKNAQGGPKWFNGFGKGLFIGQPVLLTTDGEQFMMDRYSESLRDEEADYKLVASWRASDSAVKAADRLQTKAAGSYASQLAPIKLAYQEAGWQEREMIIAQVIRAITG